MPSSTASTAPSTATSPRSPIHPNPSPRCGDSRGEPKMKLLALLLLFGALPWLMACADQPRPATTSTAPPAPQVTAATRDPHSFSHPDEVAVEHLKLDLNVDFAQKQLAGRASLRLNNRTGADRVWLDTRDLTISKVTLDDGAEAQFTLGEPDKFLGRS